VRRTALVGVRGAPVLCVEPEPGADQAALKAELLGLAAGNPKTAAIREVLFHERFPVDIRHNAKIFREKLAAWAAEKL
jgi:olefin beta-lactone synthetase